MKPGRYLACVWPLAFVAASMAHAIESPVIEKLTEVKAGVKIPTTVIIGACRMIGGSHDAQAVLRDVMRIETVGLSSPRMSASTSS